MRSLAILKEMRIVLMLSGCIFLTPMIAHSQQFPLSRTVVDIVEQLDQVPVDKKRAAQLLAIADGIAPGTTDRIELANFYLRRGQAAYELGRGTQSLEDFRLAARNAEGGAQQPGRYFEELASCGNGSRIFCKSD